MKNVLVLARNTQRTGRLKQWQAKPGITGSGHPPGGQVSSRADRRPWICLDRWASWWMDGWMDAHDNAPTYSTCQLRPPYISPPFLHYFYWRPLGIGLSKVPHVQSFSLPGLQKWFWIMVLDSPFVCSWNGKNQPHSTLAPHFFASQQICATSV